MDGMKPALDRVVPAPVAKVRMENEINDIQGAQNRRGPVMHASTRNVFAIWNQGKRITLQKWHEQTC
jgi:hypothetical protein